jgi:DNA-binding MarR family transcriptional regulator
MLTTVPANQEPAADLDMVANELRVVLGRVVRRLRRGHEPGEETLSELSVLSRLDRYGTMPAGALAEQERISPQAMTIIIGALEERGLVTRESDTADARRVNLSATAAGRALLAGRRCASARRMADALGATLTDQERGRLVDAIPLLDRLAEGL